MSCIIFGAGKIARGFIGHLLYLSHIPFIFIEKNESLADCINQRGYYSVNILGSPELNCTVKGVKALTYGQINEIKAEIAKADVIFTAVGGKNLPDIGAFIAAGIEERVKTGNKQPLNIVTCENYKKPADCLKAAVKVELPDNVGITEAVIMRSAIEPTAEESRKDPLMVNVQNYWDLYVDHSGIRGSLPQIKGLNLLDEFSGFLERKFYTYNAANGTVSYLGALLGYTKIADAAHDPEILKILGGVYDETARALSAKHHIPLDEQMAFAGTSLKKLQDYTIVDYIERNARDPVRKLGYDDRLIGSARLVYEYGIKPENLAVAAAAAIFYENGRDEFAVRLKSIREDKGIDAVLKDICGLEPDGGLGSLIKEKINTLKSEGWIKQGGKHEYR